MIRIQAISAPTGQWGFVCLNDTDDAAFNTTYSFPTREEAQTELYAHSKICKDCQDYTVEPIPLTDPTLTVAMTDDNATLLYDVLGLCLRNSESVATGECNVTEMLSATQLALAFWETSIERMDIAQATNRHLVNADSRHKEQFGTLPSLIPNEEYLRAQLVNLANMASHAYTKNANETIEWYSV